MPNPAPQRRRPDLDFELSRARDVLLAADALLEDAAGAVMHARLDLHALADHLSAGLRASPAPAGELDVEPAYATNRAAMCGLVVAAVHAQYLDMVEAADEDLQRLTSSRGPLRTDRAQLQALRRAGLDIHSLDAKSLAPYRRRIVVRALERLRRLVELERFVRVELHARLVAAYDGATRLPRPKALAALASVGADGQFLLESMVRFEAGRHIALIQHQANKLAGSYPGYHAEDLFTWGYRGLLAAVTGYDPSQWAFSTYACTRIVGAIQDGVRQESPIPKRLGTYARQVRAVHSRLGQELGRTPTDDELTRAVALERLRKELGRTPTVAELADRIIAETKAMSLLPRLAAPASIEEMSYDGEFAMPAPTDPADDALREIAREAVRTAVSSLPADEAEAVRLLDLEGLTLEEAHRRTGATSRQLRSRRDRGRIRLAEDLAAWR